MKEEYELLNDLRDKLGKRYPEYQCVIYKVLPKQKPQRKPKPCLPIHRRLVYDALGYMPIGVVVHHINGNPNDNRIENFYLFKTNAEHRWHHASLARWAAAYPFMTAHKRASTYPKLVSNVKNYALSEK